MDCFMPRLATARAVQSMLFTPQGLPDPHRDKPAITAINSSARSGGNDDLPKCDVIAVFRAAASLLKRFETIFRLKILGEATHPADRVFHDVVGEESIMS